MCFLLQRDAFLNNTYNFTAHKPLFCARHDVDDVGDDGVMVVGGKFSMPHDASSVLNHPTHIHPPCSCSCALSVRVVVWWWWRWFSVLCVHLNTRLIVHDFWEFVWVRGELRPHALSVCLCVCVSVFAWVCVFVVCVHIFHSLSPFAPSYVRSSVTTADIDSMVSMITCVCCGVGWGWL